MLFLKDRLVTFLCSRLANLFPSSKAVPSLPATARILVIKPCCLGDMLLATPVLAVLRERFPAATISLVTSPWARPAAEGNPHLSSIETWDFPARGGIRSLWGYYQLARRLKEGHFHAAVVLDRSPLVAMVPRLAGIPIRAGLDSGGRGFPHTHRVSTTPLRHEASLYLSVAMMLIGEPADASLLFRPNPEDQRWANSELAEKERWIAIHPGGGVNPGSTLLGKRWPLEQYTALAGQLLLQGHSVVLVGPPEDLEAADVIQEQSLAFVNQHQQRKRGARPGLLRNYAGQTSFGQLAAVLQRCSAFVGNDTGPMHLAVAVNTPVVAIFGPSKPDVYGPYDKRSQVIYHGEACQGCVFRGGLAVQCKLAYACTAAAGVEEVESALHSLLNAS